MKRILLLLFAISLFSGLRASDTLTIRQIYNFDVGDTFDYINYQITGDDTNSFYYSRNIITGENATLDSITYFITYESFVSDTLNDQQTDTVLVTHLDSNAIDTQLIFFSNLNYVFPFMNRYYQNLCTLIDSSPVTLSWDSMGNDAFCGCCMSLSAFSRFSKGLGTIYFYGSDDDGADPNIDTYNILIYYSKGNLHAGTPYYNSTLGLNNLSNISNIKVYPNPVSDQLQLSVINAGQINAQFIITDILGRLVYSSSVTQSESSYDISGFSSGLYTWRIVSDGAVIKTGKVIKE